MATIKQNIMYLGSKPFVNTRTHKNQTCYESTGLLAAKSHSSFAMDEAACKCCNDNGAITANIEVEEGIEVGYFIIKNTGTVNEFDQDISNNSAYRYKDLYEFYDENTTSYLRLFEVIAIGGGIISLDFTNSIVLSQADQDELILRITGKMDSVTGYLISKPVIHSIIKKYLNTETSELPHVIGGLWRISRTAELISNTTVTNSIQDNLAIIEGRTSFYLPQDVKRFDYNSGLSKGLIISDYGFSRVKILYDLGNTDFVLTISTFVYGPVSVMVDSTSVVNGFPVFYTMLENGDLYSIQRNTANDLLVESNNWDKTLIFSLGFGVECAAIDTVRTGFGGVPSFFVGTDASNYFLKGIFNFGGTWMKTDLAGLGTNVFDTPGPNKVKHITVENTNGHLYMIVEGVGDTRHTAVVMAEYAGIDRIDDPADWDYFEIIGSLSAYGDTIGRGDLARFDTASSIVDTILVAGQAPILYVADKGNNKLKRVIPSNPSSPSLATSWVVSHAAGNGLSTDEEGSGVNVSLAGMELGEYQSDTDEIYYVDDTFHKIAKIASIVGASFDKTYIKGEAAGNLDSALY